MKTKSIRKIILWSAAGVLVIAAAVLALLFLKPAPVPGPAATQAPAAQVQATAAPTVEPAALAAWKCTTQSAPWQDEPAVAVLPGAPAKADIKVNSADTFQEIKGFGGAFNEKGWEALSVLPDADRDAVIKAMFDPKDGAKFNLCRVPIGASDYAVSRYTLDETKNDYAMKIFSIDRDKQYLLPYIKAAMAVEPGLQVWASDWTPPTWMKTNGAFDGGYMKDDAKVYQAYSLYLAKFAEAYQAEGVNLFAVAVQNEPMVETHYPSCLWTPDQFKTFIKDYMGPTFEKQGVKAQIMLGTIQDGVFGKYPALLKDPDVNKYVSLVGFQWDGLASVPMTHTMFPDKTIYQTETECGNWYWKPGYDPNRPQNDWFYGTYTWDKIKAYFDAGVSAYELWNMVLDEEGKSIDAEKPWPQDAAITVDKNTKAVTYTPMFYAVKHFSYYVQVGAHYLITGKPDGALAFLNPDGSVVLELRNKDAAPRTTTVNIDGNSLTVTLPADSFNTLVIPKH